MDNIEIITTGDGSHSLLNKQLQETYHSHHGALQESVHVFIRNGLDYFSLRQNQDHIRIFEVGFGTGLNTWLTFMSADEGKYFVEYTSLESLPLAEDIWKQLNYANTDDQKKHFQQIHQCSWNEAIKLSDRFTLYKASDTLQNIRLDENFYDVVYFDAFAPNKQPEMWELPILEKVVQSIKPEGIFVTYCAKGQLKRDLRSLGLVVETLPGPPGKKEMVRATRQ